MAEFFFEGRIPPSKSLLNRALILRSHAPTEVEIHGGSDAEDVVFLLHGLGIATGIDLDALVDTAGWISGQLGRQPVSRVARALLAKKAAA